MARPKIKRKGVDWKELLGSEKELMKAAVQEIVQEILEAEMDEIVGARTADRTGYRSGDYSRGVITRGRQTGARIPQDRARPIQYGSVRALSAQ
jgi:putative transposase